MQNDSQFEAYKPSFTIQTVCSSVIGQRSKNKRKKKYSSTTKLTAYVLLNNQFVLKSARLTKVSLVISWKKLFLIFLPGPTTSCKGN